MRRIEIGAALTLRERIELGTLVRLAAVAAHLVADRPEEADRAMWLAGAWEPVREQVTRLLAAGGDSRS